MTVPVEARPIFVDLLEEGKPRVRASCRLCAWEAAHAPSRTPADVEEAAEVLRRAYDRHMMAVHNRPGEGSVQ